MKDADVILKETQLEYQDLLKKYDTIQRENESFGNQWNELKKLVDNLEVERDDARTEMNNLKKQHTETIRYVC